MLFESVNWWAVIVAAAAQFVLGMLWYSPVLFANKWMKLSKVKPKKDRMMPAMLGGALTALVTSVVLAALIAMSGQADVVGGAIVAFWAWLGFMATVTLGSVLWEGKPFSLWLLNNGYNLLAVLIMGAIIGAW